MTVIDVQGWGDPGERDWRWSIAWEEDPFEDLLDAFDDEDIEELSAMRERMLRRMPDEDVRSYLALDPMGRLRMEAAWAAQEAELAEDDLSLFTEAA